MGVPSSVVGVVCSLPVTCPPVEPVLVPPPSRVPSVSGPRVFLALFLLGAGVGNEAADVTWTNSWGLSSGFFWDLMLPGGGHVAVVLGAGWPMESLLPLRYLGHIASTATYPLQCQSHRWHTAMASNSWKRHDLISTCKLKAKWICVGKRFLPESRRTP